VNLNHIHLHVRSAEVSAAFYTRHFGMRELVWHGDMVFMRDEAGMDLALATDAAPASLPGWFHIGFRLGSASEVDVLHGRLIGEGVPITEQLTTEGDLTYFRCRDPDGYALEIYYEPDPD
jgi:catechol 2,3-dioxygenase-like lactoylglutathione lyase family enzyme